MASRLVKRIISGKADRHDVERKLAKSSLRADASNHDGCTLLMAACLRGSKRIVKLLLADLGCVSQTDKTHNSCLHYLAQAPRSERTKLEIALLVLGHDNESDVRLLLSLEDAPGQSGKDIVAAIIASNPLAEAIPLINRMRLVLEGVPALPSIAAPPPKRPKTDDELWRDKMAEAFADDYNDMGIDPFGHAAAATETQVALATVENNVDLMNDEDYAAFMRAELNKRTSARYQRYEYEPSGPYEPTADERQAEHQRRERLAQENSRRLIAEQLAMEEQLKRTETPAAYALRAADFFTTMHERLHVVSADGSTEDLTRLKLEDVPFPGDTAADIAYLLLSGVGSSSEAEEEVRQLERKLLRLAQKQWHEDKWQRYMPLFTDADQEAVMAKVRETSQLLNSMAADRN
eukprot:m.42362 g.42362  ORF g.42362 m.42362 type:complete len:406 (+) comp12873_c0_seq1:72-1289(+)